MAKGRITAMLFLSILGQMSCRSGSPMGSQDLAAVATPDHSPSLPLHKLESWLESEENETKITQDAIDFGKTFAMGKGTRDAHTKAHGCVKGTFTVNPNIPEDLKVGFFAKPATYKSWIRFSNSAPEIKPDGARGALGMAIKVIGGNSADKSVAILPNSSQDFLLVNHPNFIVENIRDYMAVQKDPQAYIKNPLHLATAGIFLKILGKKIANPLETQYWSMAAYALGENKAVKYTTVPCSSEVSRYPESPSENLLSENLAKTLATKGVCFEFKVQRFVNLQRTPVENPMQEWKEKDLFNFSNPFETVGRVTIPAQTFHSPNQEQFCENISYNPWNTTMENRPLGNLNRARRSVYKEIAKARHEKNAATFPSEPTGNEVF
ncbi:MAG: catalase family protein [Pseudomonadota bacterium]